MHSWFDGHGAIDIVRLTIEPVEFGNGLSMFIGQESHDPYQEMINRGYIPYSREFLNEQGTEFITFLSSDFDESRLSEL